VVDVEVLVWLAVPPHAESSRTAAMLDASWLRLPSCRHPSVRSMPAILALDSTLIVET
jgi:hypothetical protein